VDLGRRAFPQGVGESVFFLNGSVNFDAVVQILSQCSIDIGQSQIVFGSDFVGALTKTFVPNGNVFDRNAVTGNSRFAPDDSGRDFNVLIKSFYRHETSPHRKMITPPFGAVVFCDSEAKVQ
jgi:hypothetical protein